MITIIGIGLAGVLLFWLEKKLYERIWDHELSAEISFGQESIFQGETGTLVEVIENRKRLPLPVLKVKFQTDRNLLFEDQAGSKVTDRFYRNDMFQIGGGEKITRTLRFVGGKRGYYRITQIDLVAGDFLLDQEMTGSFDTECSLYVYPALFESPEFRQALSRQNGEVLTRRYWTEDPFEYKGIREYQPYDDMRSINWKASARTGDWKVNQKNATALFTVRIFLNVEDTGILKREEAVEAAIQMVASLSANFLRQGIRTAVYSNGIDILSGSRIRVEPGAGKGQMEKINRALSRIDLTRKVQPFAEVFEKEVLQDGKDTRLFFLSANAYEDFCGLLEKLSERREEFVWFCPVCGKDIPPVSEKLKGSVEFIPMRKAL